MKTGQFLSRLCRRERNCPERLTDDRYTYYRNTDASTGYAASSIDDAAGYCVWKLQQGYSVAEVLMVNQSYSTKDVEKAIFSKTQRRYYYYCTPIDGNLWLYVVSE